MINFQLKKRSLLTEAFQDIKEIGLNDNNTDEMSPQSEDFAEDLHFRANAAATAKQFNQPITEMEEEH